MSVKIAPDARRQFINASGVPYSGAKLFYYAAGSTTKQNTYTTSVGNVANSNPIVLDSAGRTPYGVWFTAGLTYKEVLAPSTDTDPPGSPIFTEDNLSGVNDTSVAVSQWAASSLTPTYISTTSFSVPGDQTTELHVGRRLQFSVTAGTVYGRISVSAYTTLTTITVVMDSGQTLDSGLNSFNWSILTATNPAIPRLSTTDLTNVDVMGLSGTQTASGTKTFSGNNTHSGNNAFSGANSHSGVETHSNNIVMSAAPVLYAAVSVAANATTSNIWVSNYVNLTGSIVTFTDFADAPQAGAEVTLFCNVAHVFTNNANLTIDGGVNYTAAAGDRIRVRALTTSTFQLEIVRIAPFAIQATMEAGTDNRAIVTPAYFQYHPSAPKAWVVFNGTGTVAILASYNVSSITDNGVGIYTVNFTNSFSSANYCCVGMAEDNNGAGAAIVTRWNGDTKAAAAYQLRVIDDPGSLVDSALINCAFFGDM